MKSYQILLLAIACSALLGCNTPQQKAHNKPEPQPPPVQTTQSPTSTSGESGSPQNTPTGGQQSTAGSESASGSKSQQTQGPDSNPPATSTAAETQAQQRAAQQATASPPAGPPPGEPSGFDTELTNTARQSPDVQITEVPLDENGNPIEPEPQSSSGEHKQDSRAASSGAEMTAAGNKDLQQENSNRNGGVPPTIGGSGNPDPSARGNVISIGAQTGEEKLAAANADLDTRLAKFDELMRRAREAAEREKIQASGGGDAGGVVGAYGANRQMPPSERGAGGQADSSSGLGHTPDMTGETNSGQYKHVATGPIPPGMPDGRDDDIVARQLREAASRESDPVLREKLWEEYRKYKNGVVGR